MRSSNNGKLTAIKVMKINNQLWMPNYRGTGTYEYYHVTYSEKNVRALDCSSGG